MSLHKRTFCPFALHTTFLATARQLTKNTAQVNFETEPHHSTLTSIIQGRSEPSELETFLFLKSQQQIKHPLKMQTGQ